MDALKILHSYTENYARGYMSVVSEVLHTMSDEDFNKIPTIELWDIEINVFRSYGFVFSVLRGDLNISVYSAGCNVFRLV